LFAKIPLLVLSAAMNDRKGADALKREMNEKKIDMRTDVLTEATNVVMIKENHMVIEEKKDMMTAKKNSVMSEKLTDVIIVSEAVKIRRKVDAMRDVKADVKLNETQVDIVNRRQIPRSQLQHKGNGLVLIPVLLHHRLHRHNEKSVKVHSNQASVLGAVPSAQ